MNRVTFASGDAEISEMCLGTMMFGDRCVDLFMIHWPRENMQIEPMMQALNDAFEVTLSADDYEAVTAMFDTAVKEESGGNFAPLRRALDLVAP